MSDPRILAWRQQGEVYLWRAKHETRNYPGMYCAADENGRRSIAELLALMLDSPYQARRSIRVTSPPEYIARIPGSQSRWVTATTWTLAFPQHEVADNHWHWSGDLESPTLTLGREKMARLQGAFETLADYGDFCVHGDDQKLHGYIFEKMAVWFWKLE